MSKKLVIGVMGPGDALQKDLDNAITLGRLIAENKWITLSGGRKSGVMHAVSEGANKAGGITLGILPDHSTDYMSDFIDIPIVTGMGSGRNNINVLTSDVIVACGMGPGTASEIALAIKAQKLVILLGLDKEQFNFFKRFTDNIYTADNPEDVITIIKKFQQNN